MTPRRTLNDAERLAWLRLARTENVGPITFRQLLARYGTAQQSLDALPDLAARGGRKALKPPAPGSIEREIAAHHKRGAQMLASCEPDYPFLLAAIEDAPPVISVLGQTAALHKKCVAIVGARNASLNGRKLAETVAHDLGQAGMIVVSGLARGIDTSAHHGSLATGTAAVLAGGADNIYPPENAMLYEKITATGCIVSEMPWSSEPRAQHFPRRNRIISGLSLGIVIIEAALQSGSLITARMALEQGREVFAVPGSPLDPRAAGTNRLLKQGAVLVQDAHDVLDALPAASGFAEPHAHTEMLAFLADEDVPETTQIHDQLIENLGYSPTPVDEIIRECHSSAPVVMAVLLELELAGRLQRLPGNRVCLVSQAAA